jgi:hypothetical protein
MFSIILLIVTVFLGGCAIGAAAPGYVSCTGKGNMVATGSLGGGMIYGGGGLNNVNLSWDCGSGSTFSQGKEPPAVVPIGVITPK